MSSLLKRWRKIVGATIQDQLILVMKLSRYLPRIYGPEKDKMLSTDTLDTLLELASAFAPHELCGLMFAPDVFHLCPNAAPDPTKSFLLEHNDYDAACFTHTTDPWAIVHSHPGKGAVPSQRDCALMDALQLANLDWAFIIVGMNPVEVRVFRKQGELYHLEWKWTVGPLEDAQIYYATNL
jgi:proteasome lid subunit RPN8/RPN11